MNTCPLPNCRTVFFSPKASGYIYLECTGNVWKVNKLLLHLVEVHNYKPDQFFVNQVINNQAKLVPQAETEYVEGDAPTGDYQTWDESEGPWKYKFITHLALLFRNANGDSVPKDLGRSDLHGKISQEMLNRQLDEQQLRRDQQFLKMRENTLAGQKSALEGQKIGDQITSAIDKLRAELDVADSEFEMNEDKLDAGTSGNTEDQ